MSFTVKTTTILATGLTSNTLQVTPSAALTAGSTLVVIGGAIQNGITESALLSSVADNASNIWGTPDNTRSSGVYVPNGFAAVAQNVAAGTPTITLTFNANNSNRVSGVLYEVIGAPTASALEVILKGIGTGAYVTATNASGTLSQADNLVIGCGSGWVGDPADTAGYTAVLDQTNGASSYLGAWVGHKTVATTAAVTYTQSHPDVAATGSNAMAVIIKRAAAGAAYKYKFKLRSDTFTSAVTSVNLLVWRNSGPTGVYAEEYTGLAGDAVAGDLVVSSSAIAAAYPGANVASTDTITGIAWVAGGNSTGIMTGAVEAE